MAVSSSLASLDFAIRAIQSIAFCIHSILGITEPCTGCLRGAFRESPESGGMPLWFWPVAGVILAIVAWTNFSKNDNVVLATQAYIAAFHSGGVYYHLRLKHHPAAGVAPGFFVVLAFAVAAMRVNILLALLGTFLCVVIANILGRVLVKVPSSRAIQSEEPLIQN